MRGIKAYLQQSGLLIFILIMVGVLALLSDRFLTPANLINILRQASINGIISVGMMLVILTAGIDLSVGAILALSVVVTADLMHRDLPPLLAATAGLSLGGLLGFVNGWLVSRIKVPPFIATLGMMSFARGLALAYTGGKPVTGLDAGFRFLGTGLVAHIPMPIIIAALVFLAGYLLLSQTRIGAYLYALGENREAALFSGIATGFYTKFVFTASGVLAALSGMILIARLDSAQPVIGLGYEFDAIAAVVIGGTSLAGGEGRLSGTLLGVLIIAMLNNALNLTNVSSFYEGIVKGMVIALALILHGLVRKL
ncbi:MAG: ribose ABC transporter permease [Desulfosarcinaceae bacterium]|nr:ribose ABC transporter permease [Desulfosarcinaceae bacterium]